VACEPWLGSICVRKGAKLRLPKEQCALGLNRMAGDCAETCHVWKQPKRVQAVDGVVVDALAQNNRHQGRRARVTEEAGKQHSVRRRGASFSHSPRDLLADDCTAMSHAY